MKMRQVTIEITDEEYETLEDMVMGEYFQTSTYEEALMLGIANQIIQDSSERV